MSTTKVEIYKIVCAVALCVFFLSTPVFGEERKALTAYSMAGAQAVIEKAVNTGRDFRIHDKDVYHLGGITRPIAIVLDGESADWILVGERDPDAAVLTLDDLVVALRARFLHPVQDPGVTIDPSKCQISSKSANFEWCPHVSPQKVRFFGGINGTRFGKVCFDADWLMKRVSFGLDKLEVENLQIFYELVVQEHRASERGATKVSSRFWFFPIINRVNVFDDVVLLEKLRMGVFTEVMYAEVDGKPLADLDSFQDGPSESFSRSFSDNFDAAAKTNEVLDTLRGLTRLAALSKGLVQSDNSADMTFWLKNYPVAQVNTPTEVEVLNVENREVGIRVSGGVELTALAARIKGGDAGALKELVVNTRHPREAVSWTFEIAIRDGQVTGVTMPHSLADPNRIASLCQHALFLYHKKRYDDALEALDAAFEKAPEFAAEEYWIKAIILREYALFDKPAISMSQRVLDERLRKAVLFFEKSIETNPRFAPGQYELGVTLRAMGDPRRAIVCFENAIEVDNEYASAHFGLGLASASVGDVQRAIESLKQFIALDPSGSYSDDARVEIRRLEAKMSTKRRLNTYSIEGTELSFRYPNDWIVLTPDEFKLRTKGKSAFTQGCVLVVSNPDNWCQNVNIMISTVPNHNFVPPDELNEMAKALSQNMAKMLTDYRDLPHRIVEVAGVPAMEINYSFFAWNNKQRQRSVLFVKNEKLYAITCTALDKDYRDADAQAFQFIVNSISITDKAK